MHTFVRKLCFTLIVLSLAVFTVLAGPSFFGSVSVNNNTITVSGEVVGIPRNIDRVEVTAEVDVAGTLLCRNPAGNVAPGQTISVSQTVNGPTIYPSQGRAPFSVTVEILDGVDTGCPNSSWTVSGLAGTLDITALLTGYQPNKSEPKWVDTVVIQCSLAGDEEAGELLDC